MKNMAFVRSAALWGIFGSLLTMGVSAPQSLFPVPAPLPGLTFRQLLVAIGHLWDLEGSCGSLCRFLPGWAAILGLKPGSAECQGNQPKEKKA